MIEVEIPGHPGLRLEHLVLDHNGTLAVDGILAPGVGERLTALAGELTIHVVTADTFGRAREQLRDLPVAVSILPAGDHARAKLEFVRGLGEKSVAAMGNGRNDRLMLEAAALGIAVLLDEGAAVESVRAADILCRDITSALDLLLHPLRLRATLRS